MFNVLTAILFLSINIESEKITVREVAEYELMWMDQGTHATKYGSFWKPKMNDGEVFVSLVNVIGWQAPINELSYVITSYPEGVFKEPVSYTPIWYQLLNPITMILFIKPIPEDGYKCFGDFLVLDTGHGHWLPEQISDINWNGYKCINTDWINELDTANSIDIIWDDAGGDADMDTRVFKITVDKDPKYYYRMNNAYTNTIPGPYYSFNKYIADCDVIAINVDQDASSIYLLDGYVNYFEPLLFTNWKSISSSTTTLSEQKCITKSSTFTHKSGYESSFGMKYKVSVKGEHKFTPLTKVSVEFSSEFSFSWTKTEEWSTTVTEEETECTEKVAETIECPARTTCQRSFIALSAPNQNIPMRLTLKCNDGSINYVNGTFTANGVSKLIVTDTQTPLDCIAYTDDFYDRSNGRLPFCDTCLTNNTCSICRDYYILLGNECVSDQICVEECGGTIKGSGVEGRDAVTPWSGAYCYGEDLSLVSCQSALNTVFNGSIPELYQSKSGINDAHFWSDWNNIGSMFFYVEIGVISVLLITICCLCYCCYKTKNKKEKKGLKNKLQAIFTKNNEGTNGFDYFRL